MEKMELRTYTSEMVVNSEDELRIEGLVNGTETWSCVLGNKKKFIEKINKGAFLRALTKGDRFDFLAEHDRSLLLATTENGSLELWEDEEGLKMRANIVPTSYGKDIYTLIRSKVINHMSFGFRVLKDSWKKGLDGIYERSVEELELIEVSAVRNPAYPCSAIAARNIELIEDVDIPEIEEIEEERMNPKDLEAIAEMVAAKLAEKAAEQPEKVEEVVEEVVEEKQPEEVVEIKEPEEKNDETGEEVIKEKADETVVETKIEEVVEETVEEVKEEPQEKEFDGMSALLKLLKEQQEAKAINFDE